MKEKVLLVGEHPDSLTGNANMLAAVANDIDKTKYDVSCLAVNDVRPAFLDNPFSTGDIPVIPLRYSEDFWGAQNIIEFLDIHHVDHLIFVGIDLWRYVHIFDQLDYLRRMRGFRWYHIFPYDTPILRSDWALWANYLDIPAVYSEFGFEVLKDVVSNLTYFRPPLRGLEHFQPDSSGKARASLFPMLSEKTIVFGFVGNIQTRKNVPRLLRAFKRFLVERNGAPAVLYLHTNPESGYFSLQQMVAEYNIPEGLILFKNEGAKIPTMKMPLIYNGIDCLVNCTHQEGLSWTVVESMLCGTPVIASNTTAHTELLKDTGILVDPDTFDWIPSYTRYGPSYIETHTCSDEAIFEAMSHYASATQDQKKELSEALIDQGRKWVEGIDDINNLLQLKIKHEKPLGEFV